MKLGSVCQGAPGSKAGMRGIAVMAIVAGALALSACQQRGKIDPLAGGGGLTGNWVSGDNVFTARFDDGAFTATANDTGAMISQGSYVVVSTEELRLEWLGLITNQSNSATCQRPDATLLNCTDASGRRFTLRKQA